MTSFRVGLNPLPWVLTANGFDLSLPVLGVIVEVDVPAAPTNLESTQISARWVIDHYGQDVF